MKRIKANYDRYIELEGVGPVSRPVDIDQSLTGFASLRTLRIYRFEPGSVIDGHAEEDEVFIIVLSGSVELTMSVNSEEGTPVTLAAASSLPISACAAYLPPHGAYRLVPNSQADIAYVRATPVRSRAPKVFTQAVSRDPNGITLLLDENVHAEKLSIRLVRIEASLEGVTHTPINVIDAMCEALVHVRNLLPEADATMENAGEAPIELNSWDTVSVNPGERPTLRVARSSALVLTALARSNAPSI